MKVGDIVRFLDIEGKIGTLVAYGEFSEGWWEILAEDGICSWPEHLLEVIS